MDSAPEYSYGYGPGGGSGHGQDHSHRHASSQSGHRHGPSRSHSKMGHGGEKAQHLHGESATYDNIPGYAPSESQTVYDNQGQHQQRRSGHQYSSDETKDRGIADYFYKKPDPSYSGTYGTDYHAEISVST
ncbi:hypothetical protein GGI21_000042 [Coemansia aciculifera]|nr:hypothetical protein GGI21_000042 [Coemansia aciculifera]